MNSSSSTATSTVAESFQSSWPPTGEAEEAQTGGGRGRRPCGAPERVGAAFCWSERPEEQQPAPEKENWPASRGRSRRLGKLLLGGGKASGGEEEARGGWTDLIPRLSRPPDVGGFSSRRRRPSGRCGRRRSLAKVGAASEHPSGAS